MDPDTLINYLVETGGLEREALEITNSSDNEIVGKYKGRLFGFGYSTDNTYARLYFEGLVPGLVSFCDEFMGFKPAFAYKDRQKGRYAMEWEKNIAGERARRKFLRKKQGFRLEDVDERVYDETISPVKRKLMRFPNIKKMFLKRIRDPELSQSDSL